MTHDPSLYPIQTGIVQHRPNTDPTRWVYDPTRWVYDP